VPCRSSQILGLAKQNNLAFSPGASVRQKKSFIPLTQTGSDKPPEHQHQNNDVLKMEERVSFINVLRL
jgi:hypothetical protein